MRSQSLCIRFRKAHLITLGRIGIIAQFLQYKMRFPGVKAVISHSQQIRVIADVFCLAQHDTQAVIDILLRHPAGIQRGNRRLIAVRLS